MNSERQRFDRRGALVPGRHRLLGFAAIAGAALTEAAGTAQPLPPAVPPPIVQQVDEPALAPRELQGAAVVQARPCPLADTAFAGSVIVLRDVQFDTPPEIDAESLRASYERKLGTPLPVAVLCDIRDSASNMLANKGYLADVRIPPQELASGRVRMIVVPGRLAAVRVRGGASGAEKAIERLLEPLAGKVLNLKAVERQIGLINEMPGLEATASLRPMEGGEPGEIEAVVTVRRRMLRGGVAVNNWDDNYPAVALGRIDLNGLGGALNQTSLGLIRSSDLKSQRGFLAAQQVGLGQIIARLRVTRVVTDDRDTELGTRSWFATAQLEAPIVEGPAGIARAVVGFDYFNFGASFVGIDISEDKLRVAFARLTWRSADYRPANPEPGLAPRWHAVASVEVRRGLSILGATKRCSLFDCFIDDRLPPSHLGADPTATVFRGAASLDWWLSQDLSVRAAASGQFTNQPLLANEEFVGGNFGIGRGFGANVLRGDQAIAGQLEVQYGPPPARRLLGWRAFAFLDAVRIHNLDDSFIPIEEKLALSTGGGVRLRLADRVAVEVMGAVPFAGGAPDWKRRPRILATASYLF